MKLRRKHDEPTDVQQTPGPKQVRPPVSTRDDFVAELYAQHSGRAGKGEIEEIVKRYEALIAESLAAGHLVKLPGFLQFKPVERPARRGRNPQTGQALTIPARRVVRVQVLKRLADRVAGQG